jgi:hypothetical protein
MPIFRMPPGAVRRLAATTLLSLVAAGCAAADPDLPELKPATATAAQPYESPLAGYHAFMPGPRDDWRQARVTGGMAMDMGTGMESGSMDHSNMDHGAMMPGMPMAPANNPPANNPPADNPPVHRH